MRSSTETKRGAARRASNDVDEARFGLAAPAVTVTDGNPTPGVTGTSLASGDVDPLTLTGSGKGSPSGPTDPQPGSISVGLLGGLRVRVGGGTLGSRALGGPKRRLVFLALLLHRSPPGVDSEWLENVRRMHDRLVRKDLIADTKKVAGLPFDGAERWARLVLEGDPLDESASHALLSSREARGQHPEGLQAYGQCRRLFAAEL
jgi:hypothetical protein